MEKKLVVQFLLLIYKSESVAVGECLNKMSQNSKYLVQSHLEWHKIYTVYLGLPISVDFAQYFQNLLKTSPRYLFVAVRTIVVSPMIVLK